MASSHFAPSVVSTTISDLDGWSIQGEYTYPMHPADPEEFGFDPAPRGVPLAKMEQTFTPPENNDDMMEFSFDPITKTHIVEPTKYDSRALTLDRVAQAIPNPAAAISRYGQVTPPRSNSESSVEKATEQKPTRQRRSTKASIKEEAPQPAPTGRKRRNTRKNSVATTGNPEESEKRKQSLEKNRLAAAKCRINKKEKTEQLQRDSHEMAMTNSYLKETVMRMKEEVQQMNALLLSHAKCEGCKSPEDIQKHLNALGNGFLAHRMQSLSHDMFGFPGMPLDEHSDGEQDSYFSPATDPSLLNPPLPEFDREPEFDVITPMRID